MQHWHGKLTLILVTKSFGSILEVLNVTRCDSDKKKILLLAVSFFLVFGYSNISCLLPLYYIHYGFSVFLSGLLVSSYYIAALLFRLPLASFLIQHGFRKTFVIGGALTVIGSLWMIFAGGSFICAFSARFMLGAGSAFTQIALSTYQSMTFEGSKRGLAFSLIMAGGLAPMMTVLPFCDWLLSQHYYDIYIVVPLFLSVGAALLTVILIKTNDVHLDSSLVSHNPYKGLMQCFRVPALTLGLFSILLFSVVDAAATFISPVTESFGIMASYFLSTNAAIGVFIRLFFCKVLDKYPRRILSAPLIAVMSLTIIFATISPSKWTLIVLGIIFGICMGFGFPLHLALVADYAPKNLQAQAASLMWFLYAMDFAMVPMVTSALSSLSSPVTAFRIISLLVLAGSAVVWNGWHRLG